MKNHTAFCQHHPGLPSLMGHGSPPFRNDAGQRRRCLALRSPTYMLSGRNTSDPKAHLHGDRSSQRHSISQPVFWRMVHRPLEGLTWTHKGRSTEHPGILPPADTGVQGNFPHSCHHPLRHTHASCDCPGPPSYKHDRKARPRLCKHNPAVS